TPLVGRQVGVKIVNGKRVEFAQGVKKAERLRTQHEVVPKAQAEVERVLAQKGLAEPEKFGHVSAVPKRPGTGVGQRFFQLGKKGHKIELGEAGLAAQGQVAYTGEALLRGTIAAPETMRASGRLTLRALRRGLVHPE